MKNQKVSQYNSQFARRFKILMAKNSMRLSDIAERTGNAVSTVSSWHRGSLPKSALARRRLAAALRVGEESLFREADAPVFSNSKKTRNDDAEMFAKCVRAARAQFNLVLREAKTCAEIEAIIEELSICFPRKGS